MFRESRSKLEKDAKTHSDDKIGAGFAHKSKDHQEAFQFQSEMMIW